MYMYICICNTYILSFQTGSTGRYIRSKRRMFAIHTHTNTHTNTHPHTHTHSQFPDRPVHPLEEAYVRAFQGTPVKKDDIQILSLPLPLPPPPPLLPPSFNLSTPCKRPRHTS